MEEQMTESYIWETEMFDDCKVVTLRRSPNVPRQSPILWVVDMGDGEYSFTSYEPQLATTLQATSMREAVSAGLALLQAQVDEAARRMERLRALPLPEGL